MLQPVQLQEVVERYAEAIAELRRFLGQAGVPVGTETAAREVIARVAQDRRFHRDLMSYLWLLLDERESHLRPADVLGVLAVATSGPQAASQIDEEVAHDLLRFVMESRRALDGAERPTSSQDRPQIVPAQSQPRAETLRNASKETPAVPARPSLSAEREAAPIREPQPLASSFTKGSELPPVPLTPRTPRKRGSRWMAPAAASPRATQSTRRRLVYAFSGACVLALLLGGYGLLHHAAPDANNVAKPAIIVDGNGSAAYPPTQRTSSSVRRSDASEAATTALPGEAYPTTRALEPSRTAMSNPDGRIPPSGSVATAGPMSSRVLPTTTNTVPSASAVNPVPPASTGSMNRPEIARLQPASPTAVPGLSAPTAVLRSGTPGNAIPSAGVTLRTTRPGSTVPTAVPASTLSRQLDSPKMPVYANDPDVTASGRPYPRLHRRNTSGPLQENDPELLAEMHAPNLTATKGTTRPLPGGVVRGTCLGMMAGNLMYSPSPVYPEAAAASHVQGEVRIQATVDRDGTVSSARVVSGPPLLRDAALDAVQHWRYKPYTNGGKPSPTGTVAVLEFQLQ